MRGLPERLKLDLPLQARLPLRPHGPEQAALYGALPEQLHGRRLTLRDLLNVDLAWRAVAGFPEPLAVLVRNRNLVRAATGATAEEAVRRLYQAPAEVFEGAAVGLNRPVDEPTAQVLAPRLIESLIAPEFSVEAFKVLQELRKGLQLLRPPKEAPSLQAYPCLWGWLAWETPGKEALLPLEAEFQTSGSRKLTPEAEQDLRLAGYLLHWVRASAAVVVKSGATLAVATAQAGPVAAAELALREATFSLTEEEPARGAVLALGEPLRGREALDLAGVAELSAVLVPRSEDGKHDPELIRAADEHRLALVFLPEDVYPLASV